MTPLRDTSTIYCFVLLLGFTVTRSMRCNKSSIAQKMKFSIKTFFSKCDQIRRKLDLVTFTEDILNEKLQFLRSVLRFCFVLNVTFKGYLHS